MYLALDKIYLQIKKQYHYICIYIREKPRFYLTKLAALHNKLHNFLIHTYMKRSSRKKLLTVHSKTRTLSDIMHD
jgi:hypothetical protein